MDSARPLTQKDIRNGKEDRVVEGDQFEDPAEDVAGQWIGEDYLRSILTGPQPRNENRRRPLPPPPPENDHGADGSDSDP